MILKSPEIVREYEDDRVILADG
jgi:hypothetical protein